MPDVRDAELMTVGPDEVVVTFVSDDSDGVVTRVSATSRSPRPARTTSLASTASSPATTYALARRGRRARRDAARRRCARSSVPSGRLLATIATANDVHFGETECGRLGNALEEELGPVFAASRASRRTRR